MGGLGGGLRTKSTSRCSFRQRSRRGGYSYRVHEHLPGEKRPLRTVSQNETGSTGRGQTAGLAWGRTVTAHEYRYWMVESHLRLGS